MIDMPRLEDVVKSDRYDKWRRFKDKYDTGSTLTYNTEKDSSQQISKAADGWCWWAREHEECDTNCARRILALGNQGIAVKVGNDYYASRVRKRHPLGRADFVSRALEGLWRVTKDWEYGGGASFSTYASKALRNSYLEPMRLEGNRKISTVKAQRRYESGGGNGGATQGWKEETNTFLNEHFVDKLQASRGENRTLLDMIGRSHEVNREEAYEMVERFREMVYSVVDGRQKERNASLYLESVTGVPGKTGFVAPETPSNKSLADKYNLSSERIRQITNQVRQSIKDGQDGSSVRELIASN